MAGLSGMKQISRHCNRSEATILEWIRSRAFPAVKITGSWESDTEKIDQWRKLQIEAAINQRNTAKKSRKGQKKW